MDYEISINSNDIKLTVNKNRYMILCSKDPKRIKAMFRKIIKEKFNVRFDVDFINEYIMKLEKCGFCNVYNSRYSYDVEFDENKRQIIISNIKLLNDIYRCNDPECVINRKHLNPNSFENVSKSRKMSLEEAKKWIHENNKSPFYKKEGEDSESYSKRQSRDLDFFVGRYGEKEGKAKYYSMLNKISAANKKEGLIKKYGEEKASSICKSKAITLEKLISLYGAEDGKERYINWIKTATVCGFYSENSKIDSKQAYQLFTELTSLLIKNKIISKNEDVIYKDGKQKEYAFYYIDDNKKVRWYLFDYFIKKYNIIIEFNGSFWHPNKKLNRGFDDFKVDKEKLKWNTRLERLKSCGYKILTIWDYEIIGIENKEIFMNKLIEKIRNIIHENA